jgi:hypothetical protein
MIKTNYIAVASALLLNFCSVSSASAIIVKTSYGGYSNSYSDATDVLGVGLGRPSSSFEYKPFSMDVSWDSSQGTTTEEAVSGVTFNADYPLAGIIDFNFSFGVGQFTIGMEDVAEFQSLSVEYVNQSPPFYDPDYFYAVTKISGQLKGGTLFSFDLYAASPFGDAQPPSSFTKEFAWSKNDTFTLFINARSTFTDAGGNRDAFLDLTTDRFSSAVVGSQVTPIPLPLTLPMLGFALVGLGALTRFRRG